ncbi:hypothetical protein [Advenella mimigardefordensis]|uniref:hypothetical protein n=1 Tax=Advenella mimigardefordensis TaxID=302406 RepID=UPI00130DB5E1|nr:hypothetical protein [Advenella mimigardefordensis]
MTQLNFMSVMMVLWLNVYLSSSNTWGRAIAMVLTLGYATIGLVMFFTGDK